MAIRILRHESRDKAVEFALIVDTLERNRERIRTIANMVLTLSGIMISACVALIVFAADKDLATPVLKWSLALASVSFLPASWFSLLASFLRTKYTISGEAQFVTDMLALYYSELRFLRVAIIFLLLRLLITTMGIVAFASET